ncbi:butyrophilin subfamily 2 member A2-like [Mauremys reevesii]|uniref:butyrophilin subfamily 2 member A2-like n=1 Tax=Mauremys reevesii TaxID=260615 RepID=UPI00193F71C4|nr:butyrophilin subfamily 2 member A2-like [Mauremys reevesii]
MSPISASNQETYCDEQATMKGKVPLFSPGSTVSSALSGYVTLCLTLQVHRLASAQFTVIGPDHPITASLGGEAVLPCHLSPRINAQNMEVRWLRSQYSPFVHLYHDGQDRYEQQMPEYQKRTQLLKDNITNGSVSLRIRDIQPSDNGRYKCFFQSDVSYEEALLELQVAGLGSAPDISVEGHQGRGIWVVCRSSGWYPQPEVLWRDLHGKLLPSVSENISQEANGLFQTEIAIVITKESNQKVYCCVRNPRINQERVSTIYIAELFFLRVSLWIVALGVTVAVLVVLIALASYCIWQQHRVKGWRIAQLYAVDVTLDPDTAHPKLILSEDRKRVRHGDTRQDLPDNPERFDAYPIVLSVEGFMGGRCYWEVEKKKEEKEALVCVLNVTLDPDTAHPVLVLSEDQKSVRYGYTQQDVPDNPERFDTELCVLGCEGFTSGRHCWEGEVGGGGYWAVGLARESVRRKGRISFDPKEGIWAVQWMSQFQALTSPVTPLPLSQVPRRIRVSVDYERGQVTFFNAGEKAPIFTFPLASFAGDRICPWLWVGGSRLRMCP